MAASANKESRLLRSLSSGVLELVLVLVLAACASSGTHSGAGTDRDHAGDSTARYQGSIELIPSALGPYSWPISTEKDQAQAFFDQGMQLRYAYNVDEAARSMAEARRLDPACAMCFWGEAFALGSFLNGGMSAEKAELAHAAIEQAVALAETVTPVERDLILAARVRYPEDYDPENRRPVDEAFAAEMEKVHQRYPEDHEVAVVYAVSLFLLEERRGTRDLADADLIRLHDVLTGVLEEDPEHPGACHLYVHATESSQKPELALDCAELLGSAIPVASHIQHMPSHTWNEVGLWGRSVRANMRAVQSDEKAARGLGFSYAPTHNLHMLLFAASMDGQGAVAMQAGRDYARLTGNTMYQVLTLLRFGRFAEILEVEERPDSDVAGGLWDFAQGHAELREGDVRAARKYLARVRELAETSEDTFRFHEAAQLLGLASSLLEGEILREEGDLEGAIAAFERAAELDDQQQYDEPEPIPFAARHWLGAALMEAGRFAEAELTYRTELADHPHNVWSLYGLEATLEALGKQDPLVEEDFERSTARCDTWIVASRF